MLDTVKTYLLSTEVGTMASLFGFGFTVWVVLTLKGIRTRYLFIARVPQILEAIQENTSNLSKYLSEYDESRETIEVEVEKCRANLEDLLAKTSGRQKRYVKKLLSTIDFNRGANRSKDNVRTIYTLLNGLIQQIQNLREDTKWGDANG